MVFLKTHILLPATCVPADVCPVVDDLWGHVGGKSITKPPSSLRSLSTAYQPTCAQNSTIFGMTSVARPEDVGRARDAADETRLGGGVALLCRGGGSDPRVDLAPQSRHPRARPARGLEEKGVRLRRGRVGPPARDGVGVGRRLRRGPHGEDSAAISTRQQKLRHLPRHRRGPRPSRRAHRQPVALVKQSALREDVDRRERPVEHGVEDRPIEAPEVPASLFEERPVWKSMSEFGPPEIRFPHRQRHDRHEDQRT